MHPIEDIYGYATRGFKERGITKATAEHYGVKVSYNAEGEIASHFYPYTKDGQVVAYKERKLPKQFIIHGDFKGVQLFGQNVAQGNKRIIICEGELDALAVAQSAFDKYGRYYPAVALPSASATALIIEQREWLRTFAEVIVMTDMDEPGQKIAKQIAKIVGYDKVKIATMSEKDPCDLLVKHGGQAVLAAMFDAKLFSPAGIVSGQDVWEHYKRKQATSSVPYPACLQGFNTMTQGMRLGEIVLFTSGTGAGKSTLIKEIVLEILENTPDSVGMVSLEESVGDTAQKFIGMNLKKNLSESETTEEEQYEAFKRVFSDNRLVLLDHQGSVGDGSLLEKIEQLAVMGCKYIFLDHITIAVSEGSEGKEGNEATDAVMSQLLKIVMKHGVWLGVVSHLRKAFQKKAFEEGGLPSVDDIKGSGSIKQISFDILAFARNMIADTVKERNTIKMRVLKSRFTGKTGDCGSCSYDPNTTRLSANNMVDFE